MTYSCAYWKGGAETLEEAQDAKLELVCRRLDPKAGQRVLDVGCGWGSFAIHAASRHDASVPASPRPSPRRSVGGGGWPS